MLRYPIAAGSFYPSDRRELLHEIESCFLHSLGPRALPAKNNCQSMDPRVVGFVVPHAGYRYSGPIAAHAYFKLASYGAPLTAVIVGPNHSGLGSPVAIMTEGSWLTPLGPVEVDKELALKIARSSSYLDIDSRAFEYEHSIEVQLPFLQYIFEACTPRIVPIAIGLQHLEIVKDLCQSLASVLIEVRNVVIISTSDWTHYEPYEVAYRKDRRALEFVEALDYEGLLRYYEEENLTACGIAPVAIAMCVAKELGCKKGKVLAYATSGDITGDRSAVVGYASVEFVKE